MLMRCICIWLLNSILLMAQDTMTVNFCRGGYAFPWSVGAQTSSVCSLAWHELWKHFSDADMMSVQSYADNSSLFGEKTPLSVHLDRNTPWTQKSAHSLSITQGTYHPILRTNRPWEGSQKWVKRSERANLQSYLLPLLITMWLDRKVSMEPSYHRVVFDWYCPVIGWAGPYT